MINNFTMILSCVPTICNVWLTRICHTWRFGPPEEAAAGNDLKNTSNLLCWGVFCTLTSQRGREDERASRLTACFDVNYTSEPGQLCRVSGALQPRRALNQSQQQTVWARTSQDSREQFGRGRTEAASWRPGRQTGSFQGVIAQLTSCLLTTINSSSERWISKIHQKVFAVCRDWCRRFLLLETCSDIEMNKNGAHCTNCTIYIL